MSRQLLVVDDALIIREMIKDAAADGGWEVIGEATNGQEAVEMYLKLQPDVTTLDLVMPEYDGLHALESIRALDPAAKIVVVSAMDQTATLKKAFALGASDFIVKPFDPDSLIATLDSVEVSANAVGSPPV